MLMPSVLPPRIETSPGSSKCARKKCVICQNRLSKEAGFISFNFKLRGKFTCDTENSVYLISCRKCNKAQYVWQSQNRDISFPDFSMFSFSISLTILQFIQPFPGTWIIRVMVNYKMYPFLPLLTQYTFDFSFRSACLNWQI